LALSHRKAFPCVTLDYGLADSRHCSLQCINPSMVHKLAEGSAQKQGKQQPPTTLLAS
jgi:hypothetical protein